MSLLHPNRRDLEAERTREVAKLFNASNEAKRRAGVLKQGAGFLSANGYKEAAEIITDTYIPELEQSAKDLDKQACRLDAEYAERLK